MDLQRIGDELEITALLNRYARAVDTKDWDLYRSVFTEDAHIDYSSAGATQVPVNKSSSGWPKDSPRFRGRCTT